MQNTSITNVVYISSYKGSQDQTGLWPKCRSGFEPRLHASGVLFFMASVVMQCQSQWQSPGQVLLHGLLRSHRDSRND